MDHQQAFLKLKDFFENRPEALEAARALSLSVAISVIIDDQFKAKYRKTSSGPIFESGEALKPDFIFYIKSDAVPNLVGQPPGGVGELGVYLAKMYMEKDLRIQFLGGALGLITKGYLGVLASGGPSFFKFLGAHGLSGIGKIKEFIGNLRSS